jgi:hypothetical protein
MISNKTPVRTKGGNDLMKDASKLIIPFGLYLAKQSLEKFVNEDPKSKGKKVVLTGPKSKPPSPTTGSVKKSSSKKGGGECDSCKPKPTSKVKGGACGSSSSSSAGVEGYTTKYYASATGGSKTQRTDDNMKQNNMKQNKSPKQRTNHLKKEQITYT